MISKSVAVQEYCQAYNLQFPSSGRYRILVPNIFSPTEYDSRGKKSDPTVSFRWKAEIAYEEYTVHYVRAARIRHKQTFFIHSCWRHLDASSCPPMHVNMLLACDYTNVTLKRPSNDASDRRRVKSCWEAMPDLLYAQRSGWIIERQNQRYDRSHALKRWLHACITANEYIERTSLQHATQKHLAHSQYTQNMTRIKSMAGEKKLEPPC